MVDWQHPVDQPGVSAMDRNCPVAVAARTVAAAVVVGTDCYHILGRDRLMPVGRSPVPEALIFCNRYAAWVITNSNWLRKYEIDNLPFSGFRWPVRRIHWSASGWILALLSRRVLAWLTLSILIGSTVLVASWLSRIGST